jgi:hypothetical protein
MPRYDFKCPECGHIEENVLMRITHQREDLPFHCMSRMSYHITSAPMVHWEDPNIEPFRSIADKDRTLISTSRQRKEYMKKHDLVDGNEVVGKPPTKQDDLAVQEQVRKSIEAITPTVEQSAKMVEQGLMDPPTK